MTATPLPPRAVFLRRLRSLAERQAAACHRDADLAEYWLERVTALSALLERTPEPELC